MAGNIFAPLRKFKYRRGSLYLGTAGGLSSSEIGIQTERHAITIAGAGSGKGAAVIIPNLLRWDGNALIIDPKGEAAEATAEKRERMGIRSHVIDPFNSARVSEKFRASYNPLDDLDPSSPTIKEDIGVIADGVILRPDPTASHWDDGAQAIIAGLIAYVLVSSPLDEKKNLIEVRRILRDDDLFFKALENMRDTFEVAGLCQAAVGMATAKEGDYFISNARKNTEWLDSPAMENALATSTFRLADLKSGRATVYLVLPANYLSQHGRFLRLFVRSAIEEMSRKLPNGELRGEQCLFFLDEFFSLGYIDEIAKAAGLMRGYGLQLWPVLQDLGQLQKLYGKDGADTFFGNADAHIFFGNTDQITLEYIARAMGNHSRPAAFGSGRELVGQPVMSPREIRDHVGKRAKDVVAKRMIVFAQGNDILSVELKPYFKRKWGIF